MSVPSLPFFQHRELSTRAARVLLLMNAIFLVGCRTPVQTRLEAPQNAATLQKCGFENLGNGFFYKPDLFMVKLDGQDGVSKIIISRDSFADRFGKGGRPQYQAIAMAPKTSPDYGPQLWTLQENGSCIEILVNGGGSGSCQGPPEPSVVFAANKASANTPLKNELAAIARQVAPSVYTIADKTKSHQDFMQSTVANA